MIFYSEIIEGLQFYSQIENLMISSVTLNAMYSNAFPGLTVRFSAMMIGIL
jgi:hypothetical protein